MKQKKFSKREAIKFGWQTTRANFGFWVKLILVVMGLSFITSFLTAFFPEKPTLPQWIAIAFLLFTIYVIDLILTLGSIRIALAFADGRKPAFRELFQTDRLISYVGGSILYTLWVCLGLILLIVPGVIWSIKYQYYPYLIVDRGLGAAQSIRMSGQITKGAKWDILLLGLLLGLLNILGVVLLFIGLLWTLPTAMIAAAFVYRKLVSAAETPVSVADLQNPAPVNPR